MRKILALLILLAIPAVAQFGGPMGGMRPGSMQGGGLLPGRGGDPLWVAAGPTKPKLDLDFAKRKDLTDAVSGKTSLVTFSRSAAQSPGTYVGSDGLIHDAAVNLQLYSEQFDNAAWSKVSGATVSANQAIAPDGKQTADLISVPASNGGVYRSISGTVSGQSYTWSVYVKGVAGEIVNVGANTASGGITAYKQVSLTDDWQRVSGTLVSNGSNINFHFRSDYPSPSGVVGAFDVYAWGAQLEETDPATMAPTAYIHTTSQALAAPRFDHDPVTGESLGLLVEEQRANLETQSVSLLNYDNNAIPATNSTVTLGQSDPWGGTNAGLFEGDGSGTSYSFGVVKSSADTETFSIWLKAGTASVARIQIGASGTTLGVYADVDLSSGTISSATLISGSFTAISSSIQAWGNGWYRCSVSSTSPAGNHYAYITFPAANTTDNYYFAAPQWEVGSFPTSYIPTAGSAQTRYADIAAVQDEDFATTNLISYSESFDVGWTQSFAVVEENTAIAPDGTLTADKIREDLTNGVHRVYQAQSGPWTGTFTVSAYIKAAELSAVQVFSVNSVSANYTVFDLSTETATNFGVAPDSTSITSVGNGWYRISRTDTISSASSRIAYFGLYDGSTNYLGDGVSGIYLWGASLTATEYPVDYVTTRNLLTDSQDFERGSWRRSGAGATVFSYDVEQAPDGTRTASELSAGYVYRQESILSGASYVSSTYIKNIDATSVRMYSQIEGGGAYKEFLIDTSTWTVTSKTFANDPVITDVGNGWKRISLVETSPSAGARNTHYWVSGTYLIGSFYLWGAQLEPGTTATDYVRTVDVVGKAYQWFEPTEGTVFVEAQTDVPDYGLDSYLYKIDGSSNDFIFYRNSFGTPGALIQSRAFSSDVVLAINNIDPDDAFKNAIGMKYNDFYMSEALQNTFDTTGTTVENATSFEFGRQGSAYFNGHIKRLTYWPTRQADTTLQVITQ